MLATMDVKDPHTASRHSWQAQTAVSLFEGAEARSAFDFALIRYTEDHIAKLLSFQTSRQGYEADLKVMVKDITILE